MFAAIASLTLLGTILGLGLGIAAIRFAVDGDPLVDEIAALLPGTNCGQCGMAGCSQAAQAIADGSATVTVCPGGGKALAAALAEKLGISIDLDAVGDDGPKIAEVAEENLHRLLPVSQGVPNGCADRRAEADPQRHS